MEELSALLAMQLAFPFSPLRAKALMSSWKSAAELWETQIDSSSPLFSILRGGLWKKQMELAAQSGVSLIGIHDKVYPKGLFKLQDPPLVLYYKGSLLPADQNAIAIVGTRTASDYGKTMAEKIGQECTLSDITIVSGLAQGIDTAAHRGALKSGRTIAVIGSGLNCLYPQENIPLAEKIEKNGAIISEYPINFPPNKFQFLRRNRLIAALSLGCLLVEGAIKSGSLNTMEWAFKLGVPCFALSEKSSTKNFTGTRSLIVNGKAKLVENAEEMLSLLVPEQRPVKNFENIASACLDPMERALVAHFPEKEFSLEELALRSQMPVQKLNVYLASLLLKNIVRQLPTKLYIKVP